MVLLITFSEDYYTVDLVRESLERRNTKAIRVNTDEFPMSCTLSAGMSSDTGYFMLETAEHSIRSTDVKGVWMRRYWTPRLSDDLDPEFRAGCIRESQEVMSLFMDSLSHAAFVDPLRVIDKAGNKHYQLELAKSLGIRIPRTLITNSPDRLRDFYRQEKGEIVAKLLTPLSRSMSATSFFVYTNEVEESLLEDAESLRYCPMTFQELIHKEYELRIIYVDGQYFTGKIDASGSLLGKVDWRRSLRGEIDWERYEIPDTLKTQLNQLMDRLGLTYGAIDMIKSKEGEYVFLEVNPTGEWGMIQKELEYPVSDAIANAILKRMNG
jgi:MvdC family ATP-grasp ribosomal peptide maturase